MQCSKLGVRTYKNRGHTHSILASVGSSNISHCLLSFLFYSVIMTDQLVVNRKVLDDGDCCAYANSSSSLPRTNGEMVGIFRRFFLSNADHSKGISFKFTELKSMSQSWVFSAPSDHDIKPQVSRLLYFLPCTGIIRD